MDATLEPVSPGGVLDALTKDRINEIIDTMDSRSTVVAGGYRCTVDQLVDEQAVRRHLGTNTSAAPWARQERAQLQRENKLVYFEGRYYRPNDQALNDAAREYKAADENCSRARDQALFG